MHSHLLQIISQFVMATGLLLILLLLIIPVFKPSYGEYQNKNLQHVLEINDSKLSTQRMLFKRIRRLLDGHNAATKVEVVAVGNAVCMLENGSQNQIEIQTLASEGVRFTACRNSLHALEQAIGHAVQIMTGVATVADGRIYAEQLRNDGYVDEIT